MRTAAVSQTVRNVSSGETSGYGNTEITGTAGNQLPVGSATASTTEVCVATITLGDPPSGDPFLQFRGESVDHHDRGSEPLLRVAHGREAPSADPRIDQTGRDERDDAVGCAPFLHDRLDQAVVLVPEVSPCVRVVDEVAVGREVVRH